MKQCEVNKNLWRPVLVAQMGKSLDCEQRGLALKIQCQPPTFAWKSKLKWEKGLPTVLTIKRLTGITPRSESQSSIAHSQRSIQVNGSIVALKLGADITRSPKQGLNPICTEALIERDYINNVSSSEASLITRKHYSRMHTTCLPTVCTIVSYVWGGGGCFWWMGVGMFRGRIPTPPPRSHVWGVGSYLPEHTHPCDIPIFQKGPGTKDTYPPERTWDQKYPPPCGQTDTCENITFLQLNWRQW